MRTMIALAHNKAKNPYLWYNINVEAPRAVCTSRGSDQPVKEADVTNYTSNLPFKWTAERMTAARHLAEGKTQQQAADDCKVSRQTVYRWLGHPDFAAEIDRLTVALGADRIRTMKRQVEPLSLQVVVAEYGLLLDTYREMSKHLNEAPEDFTITQLIDNARRVARRLERRLIDKSRDDDRSLCVRYEVLARDKFTCRYCGRTPLRDSVILHVDHIHPDSQGGEYVVDNLVTSCSECNLGKRDVVLDRRLQEQIVNRTVCIDDD